MWQKKVTPEYREVVDLRTGNHVIPLIEPESGAEHKLQIIVGHEACPLCGHVIPKTNLDEIDVQQHIKNEIAALDLSHQNIKAYAVKHRAPVRAKKGTR